jgi:hypothetical protein
VQSKDGCQLFFSLEHHSATSSTIASTMIGTSTFDLIFIRTCIIALHSIAPLSILYCLIVVPLYGVHTSKSLVWFTLELIALAETIFFFATLPYQVYLQREALHPPTLPKSERRELFELCNQNIPDPEAYLQTWFLGSQPDEIRRENVREFFLWAFFGRAGPAGEDDEEVEEYVEETEKLLGRRLEPGRGNAQCLRLTLDPVDLLHRSLIWYWVSACRQTPLRNVSANIPSVLALWTS